jgi:hypothetical protein
VGVPLKHVLHDHVRECFTQEGYETLPPYNNQNPAQRALVWYLAAAWKVSARRLCCGIRNMSVEDAGDKVGSLSNPAVPVEDPRYEPMLTDLRRRLNERHPKAHLHYACLPPLEITLLAGEADALDGVAEERGVEPFSLERTLDAGWIGARCREPAYAAWVRKHWPDGVVARKLLDATYYADWMIGFLSATLFPGYTLEGKRMLVRFAFLCATRALRWTPSKRTRALLAVTERWLTDPSEEHRQQVRGALEGLWPKKAREDETGLEEDLNYVDQAATDAAVQTGRSACSNDARVIAECAGRAAMGAVMTATFASRVPAKHTWLEMVSTHAVPDELAEHCALCVAMRGMALEPEGVFEDVSDPKDVK